MAKQTNPTLPIQQLLLKQTPAIKVILLVSNYHAEELEQCDCLEQYPFLCTLLKVWTNESAIGCLQILLTNLEPVPLAVAQGSKTQPSKAVQVHNLLTW